MRRARAPADRRAGLFGQRSLRQNQHSTGYYVRKADDRRKRIQKERARIGRNYPTEEEKRLGLDKFYPFTDLAPWDYSDWKAVKILGEGGNGICSLWEYQGTDISDELKHGTRVAIKNAKRDHDPAYESLQREADTMMKLGLRGDQHLVRCLVFREPGALYLEYIPKGDLWDELLRRIKEKDEGQYGAEFTEIQLWRMFLCFAKGMATMGICDRDKGWWPFMHMDFKPDNLFLGQDANHDCEGDDFVYKIGDFGWSSELKGYYDNWYCDLDDAERKNRHYMRAGHRDWYTPEQACEEWNTEDWRGSEICGNWSPQLNVWSIGAVMWQLAMLKDRPVQVRNSQDRSLNKYLSRLDPKLCRGATFGRGLEGTNYSKELKVLILSCLMEIPRQRPKPDHLVTQIQSHLHNYVDGRPYDYGFQTGGGGRVDDGSDRPRFVAGPAPHIPIIPVPRPAGGRVDDGPDRPSFVAGPGPHVPIIPVTRPARGNENTAVPPQFDADNFPRMRQESGILRQGIRRFLPKRFQKTADLGLTQHDDPRPVWPGGTGRRPVNHLGPTSREAFANAMGPGLMEFPPIEKSGLDVPLVERQRLETIAAREREKRKWAEEQRFEGEESIRKGARRAGINSIKEEAARASIRAEQERRTEYHRREQQINQQKKLRLAAGRRDADRTNQEQDMRQQRRGGLFQYDDPVGPAPRSPSRGRAPRLAQFDDPPGPAPRSPSLRGRAQRKQPSSQLHRSGAIRRKPLYNQQQRTGALPPTTNAGQLLADTRQRRRDSVARTHAWETHFDDNRGINYYWNPQTGDSQWDPPAEIIADRERQERDDTANLILPWTLETDTKGRNYYWNKETGQTQLTPPAPIQTYAGRLPPMQTRTNREDSGPTVHYPWEKRVSRRTGKTVYYNQITGITQNTVPTTRSAIWDGDDVGEDGQRQAGGRRGGNGGQLGTGLTLPALQGLTGGSFLGNNPETGDFAGQRQAGGRGGGNGGQLGGGLTLPAFQGLTENDGTFLGYNPETGGFAG